MAVAPVLERRTATEERTSVSYNPNYISDEEHNARIKQNYARLINPEANLDEVLQRGEASRAAVIEEVPVATERAEMYAPAAPARIDYGAPAFAQNARAESILFRADSEVNQRLFAETNQTVMQQQDESEEENEDLRPTPTTIQYKTSGVTKTVEEGKIDNTDAEKRTGLSKKDKIVIAAIVSVVVVMLVLIIVNSAVLSGINNDVSSLQSSLTTIKASYEGVKDELNPYLTPTQDDIARFALQLGWVKG